MEMGPTLLYTPRSDLEEDELPMLGLYPQKTEVLSFHRENTKRCLSRTKLVPNSSNRLNLWEGFKMPSSSVGSTLYQLLPSHLCLQTETVFEKGHSSLRSIMSLVPVQGTP